MTLERLYLRAWIAGLYERTPEPAVLPVTDLPRKVALDDTGRAPVVPLRPTEADRA